jgi:hypothetical protein
MGIPIETERLRLRKREDRESADILEYSADADFWLARNMDWPLSEEGVSLRRRDTPRHASPEAYDHSVVRPISAQQSRRE